MTERDRDNTARTHELNRRDLTGLVLVVVRLDQGDTSFMAYTSTELLTIIGAISALVVVVGGVVVNVIVSLRRTVVTEVARAVEKIEDVKVETTAIKTHVDGASSRAEARIDSLEREIQLLLGVNADQKQAAAVLAQAQSAPRVIAHELNGPVVDESLSNIDENTKAIAKNTARTEAMAKKLEDKA